MWILVAKKTLWMRKAQVQQQTILFYEVINKNKKNLIISCNLFYFD